MSNTVGRISGQMLEANLLREGEDLAFDYDLLYFNVNTGRIGINDDTPFRTLLVNQDSKTTSLIVDTSFELEDLLLSGNTVVSDSNLYLSASGDSPKITTKQLDTANLSFDGNTITNKILNNDINLIPAGSGNIVFDANVEVVGNLHATGDITFDGSFIIGNNDSDNVYFNAEIASDITPDVNNFYDIGSNTKQFSDIYTYLINGTNYSAGGSTVGGIDLSTRAGNIWYVATNGDNNNVGDHPNGPFSTVEWALSQATSGDTVYIYPGTYVELFPLVVPQGVTVTGAGIRDVKIVPDTASQYEDVFKLNGETTIENLTVADFYYDSGLDKGYAFSFASGFTVTSRSPYIRNISVITRGSTSTVIDGEYAYSIASTLLDGGSASTASFSQIINGGAAAFVLSNDPLGFDAADAGRGALIDGSVANSGSNEASMLFHSATFITPGVDCIVMKNGVRVEWLNSFIYYANRGLYAENGLTGFAGLGSKYGAEIRSIGSANVYGNYGAVADGDEVLMYLINHNFGYIGSGKDSSNDPTTVIHANEVVESNNGKIYFQSVDQIGNFRIGDLVTIESATGTVILNSIVTTGTNLTVTDGTNVTYVDAFEVTTGNITVSGNTIQSNSGDLNFVSSNNNTAINANVSSTKSLTVTGNATLVKNLNSTNITATTAINAKIIGDLIPISTDYALGDSSKAFRNLYGSKFDLGTILIDTNVITTTESNSDLELRANGSGVVRVSDNLRLGQNFTVSGTGNYNNLYSDNFYFTGTTPVQSSNLVAPEFNNGDIIIAGNLIKTSLSNSNLEFKANSTGGVIVDGSLKITDSTISNIQVSGTEADKSIVFSPTSNKNVKLNSDKTLKIPVGNNTTRTLSNTGEIRFNNLSSLFQSRISGSTTTLHGLYDTDLNTSLTAELTPGANDNIIRMTINGVVRGTITSQEAAFQRVAVDEIFIDFNRLGTINSNADLEIYPSGTGSVIVKDSISITDNTITNLGSDQATTINSTGTGYVKFAGTNAVRIPFGDTSQAPASPPVGATRINTDTLTGEVFDGIQFIPMVGNFSGVTATEMAEIVDHWSLILG